MKKTESSTKNVENVEKYVESSPARPSKIKVVAGDPKFNIFFNIFNIFCWTFLKVHNQEDWPAKFRDQRVSFTPPTERLVWRGEIHILKHLLWLMIQPSVVPYCVIPVTKGGESSDSASYGIYGGGVHTATQRPRGRSSVGLVSLGSVPKT